MASHFGEANRRNKMNMNANTHDMEPVYAAFYARAMSALEDAQGEVGEDDLGMCTASADDCFGWVDDLEARVGFDVADFRSTMIDYIFVREGSDEERAEAFRSAKDCTRYPLDFAA